MVVGQAQMDEIQTIDVLILGGGAAGLMTAMTAASRGRTVRVLERSNKLGKKILMSGGGRCNFTNTLVESDHFLSENVHFVKSALRRYPSQCFIELVEAQGIAYEERKHGQLFCKGSAKEILAMLEDGCRANGVRWQTGCTVTDVAQITDQWLKESGLSLPDVGESVRFLVTATIGDERLRIACRSLVVATGALSIPTLGGSDQGYLLAEQFGLSLVPRRPGLVPFVMTDDLKTLCSELAGVSLPVSVSCGRGSFTEDLLFTHRGLSGPVILQISSYWRQGDYVEIDLLPKLDLGLWLQEKKRSGSQQTLVSALQTFWPRSLAQRYLERYHSPILNKPITDCKDQQLRAVASSIHAFRIKPAGTEGYRTAEVTLGGVATQDLSSKTFEANAVPGLYFVGEVVDVSGHLGGFNFQWAWASGFCAGQVV